MKRRQLTPEQALDRLETLCARAEQCTGDLRRKLAGWGIAQGDADVIISRLRKGRWVDDERYARAFCRDKYRFNRWGRAKIKMGLIAKRVAPDVVVAAMEEIDDEVYRANLVALLKSKIRAMGRDEAATYEGRTKLFRCGASRGYEPSLVAQVLRDDELWMHDES